MTHRSIVTILAVAALSGCAATPPATAPLPVTAAARALTTDGGHAHARPQLTDEQKAAMKAKRDELKAKFDAMTDEEKAALKAKRPDHKPGARPELTDEQKAAMKAKFDAMKAKFDAMTDEEKAALKSKGPWHHK